MIIPLAIGFNSINEQQSVGHYLLANSRHLTGNSNRWSYFLTDEPEMGTHTTRAKLLSSVLREMQFRERTSSGHPYHYRQQYLL